MDSEAQKSHQDFEPAQAAAAPSSDMSRKHSRSPTTRSERMEMQVRSPKRRSVSPFRPPTLSASISSQVQMDFPVPFNAPASGNVISQDPEIQQVKAPSVDAATSTNFSSQDFQFQQSQPRKTSISQFQVKQSGDKYKKLDDNQIMQALQRGGPEQTAPISTAAVRKLSKSSDDKQRRSSSG